MIESRPTATAEIRVVCSAALGSLALAAARHEQAIDSFRPAADLLRERGVLEPRVFAFEADLTEAYVRAGRPDDAERSLEALNRRAAACGASSTLAAAARCRGLLAPEHRFETCFEQVLEIQQGLDDPIGLARTMLCQGERRRRHGRRSAARDPLRAALAIFEQRGASLWADRARKELLATGESLRPRGEDPRRHLTPQELQIALLAVGGARNREIATSLFLSPKTVEAHLTRVYRKLAVTSRTQLAARLGQGKA